MTARDAPPPPPGSSGLPLLGETLALLRDPFGFIESRAQRFGPVFRTRVLGRATAVITGPDATARFIDGADVQRTGAMPANIQTLFGGRALPVMDGSEHRTRKHAVMAAFSREALESYVPRLAALARAALARWAGADEIRGVDELRRLAIEAIAETMIGLSPGPAVETLRTEYGAVLRGLKALPVALPGTGYARGKSAVRRILASFEEQVRAHEAAPRDDGLSRILTARGEGSGLDAPAIAQEVHHLVLAGLIVWAWCARMIVELEHHPGMRARLLAEMAPLSSEALSLAKLEGLPYLDRVVNEVRRAAPVVPIAFGKARRTFTFAGHTIPEGWMVLWGPAASHVRPEVYPAPERFDPERFSPERAEHRKHEFAFAPNGAGDAVANHKCAGYELAPTLLKVFTVELLRGYTCLLAPDQDLTYDWSEVPPAPRSGLRLRVHPK